MNKPFRLQAPYSPAGDQPRAIAELTQALSDTKSKAVLVGVTGSGKTMTMASVIQNLQRPTLVMTHNKTLAAQLYREFKDFFPDNAVEYFISYYDYYQPEAYVAVSDTYIEKESSINAEIEMLRLRATASLIERKDVIIIASVSCIYGLGSPEAYRESVLFLRKGAEISREVTMQRLMRMQYSRNDTELSQGNFRVRGDILEILPAYSQEAYRLEYFEDTLENITKLEMTTGKKKEGYNQIAIYPAKHFITTAPLLSLAMQSIKEELQGQIEKFKAENKPLEAERIRQRTMYDLEMLKEMGYCQGIENYSRHLTQRASGSRPECLLDYFPEEFLIIIDESHVTVPQIGGMFAGDRSRKENLVNFGFRLPSALDNRPLNFPEFESIAKNVLFVSATPSEYELQNSDVHVEQLIRPTGLLDPVVEVHPTEGQIDHLAAAITRCTEKKERVLVTTLTKKMAEKLTDYYAGLGIKVRYMHSEIDALERAEILRDLRKGVFDVLVGINLLREGLDLPEVSLVAILDADKEGFLRSHKSLIQTMGRAARNINGKVILYADVMTNSMNSAIQETDRRRRVQHEHNEKNGISPETIKKEITDFIERERVTQQRETEMLDETLREFSQNLFKDKKKWEKAVEKAMLTAAENLDFERAALLRDLLMGKD